MGVLKKKTSKKNRKEKKKKKRKNLSPTRFDPAPLDAKNRGKTLNKPTRPRQQTRKNYLKKRYIFHLYND